MKQASRIVAAVFAVYTSGVIGQIVYQPETVNIGFAFCFNPANGEIVPNCDVTVSNGFFFEPRQHNHDNPPPPVSALNPTSGNTGITGLPVTVTTTRVGQVEGMVVCADLCTITPYFVAYTGFTELSGGSNWVLIGVTNDHPENHWGTPATISGIQAVASQYHAEFPNNDVIGINDIALPIGGIFDLNRNWAGPHFNHSRGKAVDIRGNGMLPNSVPRQGPAHDRFLEICMENGATAGATQFEEFPNNPSRDHFHCEWP